jgi:hypothetical protein
MNLRKYISIFLLAFGASAFLASCLNEDNKIPPNCYDGVLNNGEFLTDCGGPNCPECNHCIDGIWQQALGETYVDCGGECPACNPCWNGVRDGDETGIDCGGQCNRPCGELCDDNLLNGTETELDCGGNFCPACPTCTDQLMNGDEVGIDCGGSECNPCVTDGNCRNGIRDGDEFWTDCGGTTCPDCKDTLVWYFSQTDPGQYVPTSSWTVTSAATFTAGGASFEAGSGTSTGNIGFSITKPGTAWISPSSFTCNETTDGIHNVAYVDAFGVTWSSANPNAECTVSLVRYVNYTGTPAAEFWRFYFSGTLADDAGNTLTFTSGVFQYTQ